MSFAEDWNTWHKEREEYYRDPLGWVALTGLYWLTDEFDTVADLPGRWRADADAVYIEGLDVDRLEPVEGAPGILVEDGDRRIEVIRRTGSVALRVHDPASPHLERFTGIPSFAPDEKWSVAGTFTAYPETKVVTTGAVVEGLEHHHTAVGTIDFELGGEKQRFVAFGGTGARGTTQGRNAKNGGLQVLFTDATSGVTTYPASRSLSVELGQTDSVVLDFNRASNLPCAFTDYATCPVAPADNKLAVAVEAGEKTPEFEVSA